MPSLLDSIGNFISSIFNAIMAVFSSIIAVFQSILNTILGVIQSTFSAMGTMISGLAQTFEGLVKFLLSKFNIPSEGEEANEGSIGNILVIGVVVGGLFLYGVYQQKNGRPVTAAPAKKTS
ncbi:uncharacterized protein LY89DRAFT_679884 [Mollisia scopiformis]|uniref:Uncharacterized protein n=1 Tax=Mollisia scopiformis TaxID=149040 RepID=A0A194XRZ6_MOLSC|nr:uncharacterized protein LY89DRAFT_679884 [Mollisia scopiformis]KUJ23070.1 hypothetical protein LY89DRAFT_679884 [Mollisia scopiformis]